MKRGSTPLRRWSKAGAPTPGLGSGQLTTPSSSCEIAAPLIQTDPLSGPDAPIAYAMVSGMKRVRISTTVDAWRLARTREMSGLSDSQLLDRALAALLGQLEHEREIAALERHPYDEDPQLSWGSPATPLPYDGNIPDAVVQLAQQRRAQRQR